MRLVQSTTSLVVSRMRFDLKRHAAAVLAVGILMASLLTFSAFAAGMQEALVTTLTEGGHGQVQLTLSGFGAQPGMSDAQFQEHAAYPGVLEASARSAKSIGLDARQSTGPGGINLSFEIILVGIDPVVEQALVVPAVPGADIPTPFSRGIGYHGQNYTLLDGRWIQGATDAVVTQAAAEAGYAIGTTIAVDSSDYTVVGVIAHAPPFTVPGIIPAGHVLVDRDTQNWPDIQGAYFRLEPDFAVIHAFSTRLIEQYPTATGSLHGGIMELERQFFESARSQQVLQAAGRLVALAGAATVFAMSLFLLISERRSLGTMSAIGFTRSRLASYMNQKMVLIALAGTLAGGAAGVIVVAVVPVPAMSFPFSSAIDASTYARASLQTLAAALGGSLVAFLLTIRQDPIQALRVTE